MRIIDWGSLNAQGKRELSTLLAFLEGRLEERETINWALRTGRSDSLKHLAVLTILDGAIDTAISEPWRFAWRLIEQSWTSNSLSTNTRLTEHLLGPRVSKGERTGGLIGDIVALVAPRFRVEQLAQAAPHKRYLAAPRTVADLMHVKLESGDVVDPSELRIDSITEESFLVALADKLGSLLTEVLQTGGSLNWPLAGALWRYGELRRVYYVSKSDLSPREGEPDRFHSGIAPTVKLLFAVVYRLAQISPTLAASMASRWSTSANPIYVRLWAAFTRNPRFAAGTEVAHFLIASSDQVFWNLHEYPEVAEMRARRFGDFDSSDQDTVLERLRTGPPRSHWSAAMPKEKVAEARRYWIARELKRIELAGHVLPPRYSKWLLGELRAFDDLARMTRIDEGFLGGVTAGWVQPNPEDRYDRLSGIERLRALEAALRVQRRRFGDDAGTRAADWIREPRNSELLIEDFERAGGTGEFPHLWERFGWSDGIGRGDPAQRASRISGPFDRHVDRVLALLSELPSDTARFAIEGITFWLSAWEDLACTSRHLDVVWNHLWPLAVEATNSETAKEDGQRSLNLRVQSNDDEPSDLDTLNTAAGHMVGVFLFLCGGTRTKDGQSPFDDNDALIRMRDLVSTAPGRSGLIARYRLTEWLAWFLHVDRTWTIDKLIAPLRVRSVEATILWRAVARRTQDKEVLALLGVEMIARALDVETGRKTRQSLVLSLIVEVLHSFREKRPPVVSVTDVQQMLRTTDDEARANAASVLPQFIEAMSGKSTDDGHSYTREVLLRESIDPFLKSVWPQEKSLVSRGTARALARLPAVSGEAFVEAFHVIEPFLMPFDCWSMIDFGLYGEEGGEPRLSKIDTRQKAEALVLLLDKTVGTGEGAIVPHDLDSALLQIRSVAPSVVETRPFRRLTTLVR